MAASRARPASVQFAPVLAGLDGGEQVAAIARLSAGGVPVLVAVVGPTVTITTGSAEFPMHAVSGVTLAS